MIGFPDRAFTEPGQVPGPDDAGELAAARSAAMAQRWRKASRSALIVSACVVGMPWGKPA